MTHAELVAFYKKRKTEFSELLLVVQRKINRVSNTRIGVAILFLGITYLGFTDHNLLYLSLASIVIFILLVQHHARLFEKKTHLENLVKLNDGEGKAAVGDYSFFASGLEFIDPHHPYSHDLDIFGEGSLFQSINRCNTRHGKKNFADRLSSALPSREIIQLHQQASLELSGKTDF